MTGRYSDGTPIETGERLVPLPGGQRVVYVQTPQAYSPPAYSVPPLQPVSIQNDDEMERMRQEAQLNEIQGQLGYLQNQLQQSGN